MEEGVIVKIGRKAGELLSIGYQEDHYLGGRYIRVRVEINVRNRLLEERSSIFVDVNQCSLPLNTKGSKTSVTTMEG